MSRSQMVQWYPSSSVNGKRRSIKGNFDSLFIAVGDAQDAVELFSSIRLDVWPSARLCAVNV
jgi:hypothetical protein